jgi:hypothetical protein
MSGRGGDQPEELQASDRKVLGMYTREAAIVLVHGVVGDLQYFLKIF